MILDKAINVTKQKMKECNLNFLNIESVNLSELCYADDMTILEDFELLEKEIVYTLIK